MSCGSSMKKYDSCETERYTDSSVKCGQYRLVEYPYSRPASSMFKIECETGLKFGSTDGGKKRVVNGITTNDDSVITCGRHVPCDADNSGFGCINCNDYVSPLLGDRSICPNNVPKPKNKGF